MGRWERDWDIPNVGVKERDWGILISPLPKPQESAIEKIVLQQDDKGMAEHILATLAAVAGSMPALINNRKVVPKANVRFVPEYIRFVPDYIRKPTYDVDQNRTDGPFPEISGGCSQQVERRSDHVPLEARKCVFLQLVLS